MRTSELTGAALDWAVAKCEEALHLDNAQSWLRDYRIGFSTRYSTVWSASGPIIEREQMSTNYDTDYEYDPKYKGGERWVATHANNCLAFGRGTTHLIAAMRCYVASKLGDEVDVPEELT